jgi:hypothetical protein
MQTLRVGSKGEDVEKWQYFLRGVGIYFGEVDGSFGPRTKEATQEFQRRHALIDDGVAGNRTIGEAMRLGFAVIEDDPDLPDSLDGPARPKFSSLGQAGREAVFGRYPFESTPTESNPEAIRITSDWAAKNIVTVTIPQLAKIKGAPASGKVQFHELVAPRVARLFQRWEDDGLLELVLTYGGSFVPRFVRGSRTTLSPHARAQRLRHQRRVERLRRRAGAHRHEGLRSPPGAGGERARILLGWPLHEARRHALRARSSQRAVTFLDEPRRRVSSGSTTASRARAT